MSESQLTTAVEVCKRISVQMMAVQNGISGLTLVWIAGQGSLFRSTMKMVQVMVHCQA